MTVQEAPTESFREGSLPVLETERLVLRAPRLEDAKAIASLANDRRIAENTRRIPHPYTRADAEDFIAAVNDGNREIAFVVTLAEGSLIGACGLTPTEGEAPELGYWIGVPFWGRGFATEALRAVIDYVLTEFKHDAIQAAARVTNPPSRRLLEKCGFQWTGVGLCRIRALASSAPIDRFRLERNIWFSLKQGHPTRRVT